MRRASVAVVALALLMVAANGTAVAVSDPIRVLSPHSAGSLQGAALVAPSSSTSSLAARRNSGRRFSGTILRMWSLGSGRAI